MKDLLALKIGDTTIEGPAGIPTGGLPKAYDVGSSLLLIVFVMAVLLAFGFIIWGGIRWISSGGDKTKVQNARNTLVYAVVGLIFIFLSFLIINIITYLFNVPSVSTLPQ